MNKIVVKFGGSSLASAEQFQKVGKIIKSDEARCYVVPSAPGKRFSEDIKVTDMLYECYALAEEGEDFDDKLALIKARYREIIDGLSLDLNLDKEFEVVKQQFLCRAGKEYAASRGEYLNGLVMASFLGYEFVDAAEVIRFNKEGEFMLEETDRILGQRLARVSHGVIPGFYGADEDGVVHTFSRGGSDVTGSIVARASKADMYENWTDVSGFLVADPRIVKNPQGIDIITYKELRELAHMGASVLHEDAIFPVREEGIPINIRNTNAPEDKGTMIVANTCCSPEYTITGIAGHRGFSAITIEKDMMNAEVGYGRRVFDVFLQNNIKVEHAPSGIDTMTVFVHAEEFEGKEDLIVQQIYEQAGADHIEVVKRISLIAIVGRGMKRAKGTAGRVFSALAHAHVNVNMIDQGSSEINIIIGVEDGDFKKAIRALYDAFVTVQL